MRKTHALIQVALALLDDSVDRHWGYDLSKRARVRSGVLYPMLQRMLVDGWLADGWEEPPLPSDRPARRYYQLTDEGRRKIGGIVADAGNDIRFAPLFEWTLRGTG
jgi:PadR family transcriptional regulator PadR